MPVYVGKRKGPGAMAQDMQCVWILASATRGSKTSCAGSTRREGKRIGSASRGASVTGCLFMVAKQKKARGHGSRHAMCLDIGSKEDGELFSSVDLQILQPDPGSMLRSWRQKARQPRGPCTLNRRGRSNPLVSLNRKYKEVTVRRR